MKRHGEVHETPQVSSSSSSWGCRLETISSSSSTCDLHIEIISSSSSSWGCRLETISSSSSSWAKNLELPTLGMTKKVLTYRWPAGVRW